MKLCTVECLPRTVNEDRINHRVTYILMNKHLLMGIQAFKFLILCFMCILAQNFLTQSKIKSLPFKLVEHKFHNFPKFRRVSQYKMIGKILSGLCISFTNYPKDKIIFTKMIVLKKKKNTFLAICHKTHLPIWNFKAAPQNNFFDYIFELLLCKLKISSNFLFFSCFIFFC